MSMQDPLADMITRIRNAQMAQLPRLLCRRPKSKFRLLKY
jgi:ribosomal protein S8